MTAATMHHPEMRAAGTDLSERRRSGVSRGTVSDIEPIAEMTRIEWSGDGAARIGSLVTIAAIAADARLRQAYPGLAAAAASLATPQIRAVATLGGNIAQRTRCWYFRNPHLECLKKGSPICPARQGNHLYGVAFDLGPCVWPHPSTLGAALLAYEAGIVTDRRSHVDIAEIFGDGRDGRVDNTLLPGERIVRIEMGIPRAGERAVYRRAISRAYAEWPLVEIVARIVIDAGRCAFARVAAGGVAPVPLRLDAVEDALVSKSLDESVIRQAAGAGVRNANPLPQTGYKVGLMRELMVDVLSEAAG